MGLSPFLGAPAGRSHPGGAGTWAALAIAAAGAALYLVLDPTSGDLFAQTFRTELQERAGFTVYSTAWYGGHHTPGYSVLFPPLAALLGERVVAALATVAATAALAALAGPVAAALAVPALLASLVSGRLTFTLGAALGLAATLAADRRRTALAALGGVVTALASPVAALFIALAGAALLLGTEDRRRAGLALAAGAAVPTLLLVLAFPEGGTFPFAASAFVPAFLAGVAVAVAAPPGPLKVGGLLYALLCLAAFVVPSPVGGNAVRLGTLLGAPVAVALLWPHRRLVLAALALPLAYWIVQPAVRDVLRTNDDPSTSASFYAPLLHGLARDGRPMRVEVPFTQAHGEVLFVARRVAIARGWERQVDRERNALFYDGAFSAGRYERWLRENAVRYVALPLGVPFDASGEAERRLVAAAPPFLREIARAGRWRIFAVRRPQPLADGVATLTRLGPDRFDLRARRAGASTVRVRFSPWFAIVAGRGCVEPADGGWTRVRMPGPGTVTVAPRLALGRLRARSPRCA
jgi:hypothetical protein